MINVHKLCLSFGTQKLFDHLSFTLNDTQRVGLVGRNGSGKSTLLKILSGYQQPDEGVIALAKHKKLAYFPQEVVLQSDKTILDETLTAFGQLHEMQQEASRIEQIMQEQGSATDEKLVDTYLELQEQLADLNPERMQADAQRMLNGLGFKNEQLDKPVDSLSVGWKMRIVLAKLLLQQADFYLFDEPTNHLDMVAREWFLKFLKTASFGFMIVCHERYFLNQLCNDILELELGNGTFYTGNYDKYEILKRENLEHLKAAQAQQQKEIKRKRETAERFRAKSSKAKMAQSIFKQLEKIELIELPPEPKDIRFSFPPAKKSGRLVLMVKDVSHKFGDKQIFNNVQFEVERGSKIAIIAPNGVGKTTLFNLIIDKFALQQGKIEFGYNVHAAIFDQDQTKSLDLDKTVLYNLEQRAPTKSEQTIRSMLGTFLFGTDDVEKKVRVLSGGEKNRVGMINVLLQDANLLLLDEPTNHLDIPSKDILLRALQEHPGTMLFVSHDHDFINKLATHIIELTAHGTMLYHGNYESYLYAAAMKDRDEKKESTIPSKKKKQKEQPQVGTQNSKEFKKLERKIEKIEGEIKRIEFKFAELAYGSAQFDTAQKKLVQLKQELDMLHQQWESLI